MTGPLAERLPAVESQQVACPGCTKPFEQRRLRYSNGTSRPWSPDLCPECLRVADEIAAKEAEENRRRSRLTALEVPPRYKGAVIEDFAPHGSEENRGRINRLAILARRYLADWPTVPQQLLVFRGGPGTGKGHLAWAIARSIGVDLGGRVKFVKLPTLIRDLRESWKNSDGPTEEERLKAYRIPDLLVIDEVSRHAFYGEPTRHLYDVLDDRCDWCRPTILTTNESDQGISDLLGPALVDRVIGYGGLVEFGNESFRQRPRQVTVVEA